MDFDRGGLFAKFLKDFMFELDLCVCDLGFSSSVKYTYECDDSLTRFWLDHVLCLKCFSNIFMILMQFTLLQYTTTIFLCFSTLISLEQ